MNQLKAELWVKALIRRAEISLASALVIRRGDETAGIVLVKVVFSSGLADLYVPGRDEYGERLWRRYRPKPCLESEIDFYCEKQADMDPDLWIVEIMNSKGQSFILEPVEVS